MGMDAASVDVRMKAQGHRRGPVHFYGQAGVRGLRFAIGCLGRGLTNRGRTVVSPTTAPHGQRRNHLSLNCAQRMTKSPICPLPKLVA